MVEYPGLDRRRDELIEEARPAVHQYHDDEDDLADAQELRQVHLDAWRLVVVAIHDDVRVALIQNLFVVLERCSKRIRIEFGESEV